MHKSWELRYKSPHIYHSFTSLILNLAFRTKDFNGIGDPVNIFLLLNLFLTESFEVAVIASQWDMAMDSSIIITSANNVSPLQRQKFAPIVGLEV